MIAEGNFLRRNPLPFPFFSTLNNREIKIIELTCEGYSAWKIGKQLNLAEQTVKNLKARLVRFAGVKNSAQLVAEYIKYRNGYN